MKVGQFTDTFLPVVDGVGRVASNYAAVMGDLCEACYVITPQQKNLVLRNPSYELVDYKSLPLPGMPHYRIGWPALDAGYRRRMANIQMDIVHAHDPFITGCEAYRVSRRQGIPLVATFHSKYYDDFYQITHSKILSKRGVDFVVRFYSQCDQVWTVSHSAAQVLRGYGYAGPLEVVQNGTDRKEPNQAAVWMVNERYGLGQHPVLLYVGQMNWKKNIRRILEAAGILAGDGRELRLVMAGQGPAEREIQALSSSLGLDQVVIYTGQVNDAVLEGLYARAALFLFPSLYDTAGLVVSEAAALGTPSLLVAGSSAAETVRDGENGLLTKDTSQAMAERIIWALEHPEKLRGIGQAARLTIPKPWKTVVVEVLERYEALISAHPHGRQLKSRE